MSQEIIFISITAIMRNLIFYKRSSLLKVLLASSVACASTNNAFAKVATSDVASPAISQITNVQKGQTVSRTVSGVVKDASGEPLIGVSVVLKGTGKGTVTDIDGRYTLPVGNTKTPLTFSYVGYVSQDIVPGERTNVDVVLKEENTMLTGVVVTAMGIMRKESSLTYSTQKIKAEDLTKVQDPNVANSLEGKISGITITPSAGGAGGASKITLRGNKSIMGNSSPLIVVDGVPMTNNTRGRKGFGGGEGFEYSNSGEGSDPLSMINPDDIESINVLKGANAAALYGSNAANGVVMITTKKGREGKLDINFASNVTLDTPLLLPKFQNTYGAAVTEGSVVGADEYGRGGTPTFRLSPSSWGGKLSDQKDLMPNVALDKQFGANAMQQVHLRNQAENDAEKYFRTGVTTNNSVSLSGGTEKSRSYFSLANSHATGMIESNSYNRNTITFRQTMKFFDRLNIDASLNYVETVTRNRPGGGTVGNPIYHLYMMPRNIDFAYYRGNYARTGTWLSNPHGYYQEKTYYVQKKTKSGDNEYEPTKAFVYKPGVETPLEGPMQNWAYMSQGNNNPYWLTAMNQGKQEENRLFTTLTANLDIYKGLSAQARFNYTKTHYHSNKNEYATTFLISSMSDYGRYWDTDSRTSELYIDYLLNYNNTFKDFSVSASAGWVGHTIQGTDKSTNIGAATYYDGLVRIPSTAVNQFETNAGFIGATGTSNTSNWDRAWLLTGQVGWQEKVYLDASYRWDSYRPYRYFHKIGKIDTEWFGYFGVGANAIVSSLVKLPTWFNYLKYRASYSQVGNSIPNRLYYYVNKDKVTGTSTISNYADFVPTPEIMKSFETGVEALFLNNRLSFDLTYYNSRLANMYLEMPVQTKTQAIQSGLAANQGFETTIGYDFKFGKDLRWRTSYNLSYNHNKILKTAYNADGTESHIQQYVAGAYVIYKEGGSIGDIYIDDFARDANGHIKVTSAGRPMYDQSGNNRVYVGNMNSNWQMGWNNTFNYKDFQLSFLVNGRIGGKVISLTEAYLDGNGLSARTGEARMKAERDNIIATNYGNVPGIELPDGSGRIVPIEQYYRALGTSSSPNSYIYDATNFRLRELSLGYTFRDLFGQNKNLSVSFIARNLFFIYKDSPTDPDVSLSTANGLGGFELFNMPSSRSYGLSLKLNL